MTAGPESNRVVWGGRRERWVGCLIPVPRHRPMVSREEGVSQLCRKRAISNESPSFAPPSRPSRAGYAG